MTIPRGPWLLACTVLLFISMALRIAAGLNDLWLDEIWSLELAGQVKSPIEIFTSIHHDNNHFLNTLWMWLLGKEAPWLAYRLPSIVSGTLAVVVSGIIGLRRDRVTGLTCAILMGSSYLQVHYSSEARGYAQAILLGLISYEMMSRYLERPGMLWAFLFSCAATLGTLSHLIFLHFYLAFLTWSLAHMYRNSASRRSLVRSVLACNFLPLVSIGLLYMINFRRAGIGGGPQYSTIDVVLKTAALSLGLAPESQWAVLAVFLVLLFLALGLRMMWKECPDSALVFVIPIFLICLHIAFFPPKVLFVRYFLAGITLFLVLLGFYLGRLFSRGAWGKLIYSVVLLLIISGNLSNTSHLLKYGRGNYLAAMRFMSEHTQGGTITIGSDHDFRNALVLNFYKDYLKGAKKVDYFAHPNWPGSGPEWFIVHLLKPETGAIPQEIGVWNHSFVFAGAFPYSRLSGFHWLVYRSKP